MADVFFSGNHTLLVEVETRACAVPLRYVIETMRPLPIESIAGVPPFVRGVSVIRGVPTPVVDLAVLLGATGRMTGKFVTLRLGNRQVALFVDRVLGVRELNAAATQELPPLLTGASQDAIGAIGILDHQMLVLLRASWQLPIDVLSHIEQLGEQP